MATPSNTYAPPKSEVADVVPDGEKWLGIKDVRTDGSRASFARIFWLRNVVNSAITFIPIIGSLYGLIDILFIFGPAKRCVHDYIADTIVIRA